MHSGVVYQAAHVPTCDVLTDLLPGFHPGNGFRFIEAGIAEPFWAFLSNAQ